MIPPKMVSFIVDLCSFSPNGFYLACVIQTEKRILVRNCEFESGENKFKVGASFSLEAESNPVSELSWSPDSLFIGASCNRSSVLSAHSLRDKNWKCKISFGRLEEAGGGGIGLDNFWWGRDARHLLCLSKELLLLSVWSIQSKSVHHFKELAKLRKDGHSFSPDGSHLAVAHVDDSSKFYIGLYSSKTWKKEASFYLASKDLAGISWSPSPGSSMGRKEGQGLGQDSFIACWDSPLFSNLYIYSAQSGQLVKHYSPYGMASGFDSVQWSASAHFLICTAHGRNELHVLNGLTFGVLIHDVLEPSYVDRLTGAKEDDANVMIFSEVTANGNSGLSKYRKVSEWPTLGGGSPTKLHRPGLAYSWNKGAYVKLHPSGNQVACLSQLYPTVIWIYQLHTARLVAVLIHENPVLDCDWSPTSPKLAIICCSPKLDCCASRIYLWSDGNGNKSSCSAVIRPLLVAPTKYSKRSSLRWSPHGDLLTLRDHDANRFHVLSNF